MIFDGHSDIWYDVVARRESGERNVFDTRHYERLKKGKVEGGFFVLWIDPPNDVDPVKRVRQIMAAVAADNRESHHIRRITNYVGQVIYEDDCVRRDLALEHLKWLEMTPERPASVNDHVLYIEMDGAMFNIRKQENNSTWKENKLGLVFSSKNLIHFRNKKGEDDKRIGKRDYISY